MPATVSNDAKNHLQNGTMFGLTQITQSQTSMTHSSILFIDHIIGKLLELNLEGSTRKNKFCFLKNYAINAYKNDVRKKFLPNYKYSEGINWAYSDFLQKLLRIIDKVVLCKTKLVKGSTQNWFDGGKFFKSLCQGTNSLNYLRKQGFISIKNCTKRLKTTHKS